MSVRVIVTDVCATGDRLKLSLVPEREERLGEADKLEERRGRQEKKEGGKWNRERQREGEGERDVERKLRGNGDGDKKEEGNRKQRQRETEKLSAYDSWTVLRVYSSIFSPSRIFRNRPES